MKLQMKLQTKPNRWSCYPTAWAMAIGIPVDELIKEIGHDGGEIIWPEYCPPANRRGFHSQEMIRVALRHRYAPVPIELYPVLSPNKSASEYIPVEMKQFTSQEYFNGIVNSNTGVIECLTDKGHNHAVAFENGMIFDPEGELYLYKLLKNHGLHPLRLWELIYLGPGRIYRA